MSDSTTNSSSTTNSPQTEPATQTGQHEIPAPAELQLLWRECEARIKTVREDIEKLLTNSAPAAQGKAGPQDEAKMRQVVEILSSLATDPFALIKRGVRDAQRTAHPEVMQPKPDTAKPAPQNFDGTNAVTRPSASAPATNGTSDAEMQAAQLQSDAQTIGSSLSANVSPAAPGGALPGQDLPPFESVASDGPAILRAQAAQASGERLQTALEQSTQFTASLFDQMLALIDSQNQKLGEVDRKISELNGQLNSLKNP